MFRRVAAADDDAPIVRADAQHHTVGQPVMMLRHRRHRDARVGARLRQRLGLLRHAAAAEQRQAGLDQHLAGVEAEAPPHAPLGFADPQFDAERLGQPAGKADMVRVSVGDDEARDLAPRQRAGKHALPHFFRGVGENAGIDQRDAVAIFQEPQIDMVERHRQRHGQPPHAGRDVDDRAGIGVSAAEDNRARRRRRRDSRDALDDGGDALADADAHGDERVAARRRSKLAHRGQRQPRARGAERMADRDGAAIGIDARVVERRCPSA